MGYAVRRPYLVSSVREGTSLKLAPKAKFCLLAQEVVNNEVLNGNTLHCDSFLYLPQVPVPLTFLELLP